MCIRDRCCILLRAVLCLRQKGIQQTYGKEKGRFPYQYRRTGADRGNTYARPGEGRNCGPFAVGPGHQGHPAQIRQGQLPHSGRSHSAGRGDVHRLHDHRRQGTDVLGGLLPGGRECQIFQILFFIFLIHTYTFLCCSISLCLLYLPTNVSVVRQDRPSCCIRRRLRCGRSDSISVPRPFCLAIL